ncbi:MAG: hypothetical protein K6E78_09765, partial [Treponema sp.]|nr:hypothetical protein [Treponema sp.]
VTVSVKNIRIQEESEEDAREVKANVWSEKDYKDVEVFSRENEGLSEAVVTFKGTYKSTEYWKQGAAVWMVIPKEGYGLYKITYTVNAQNETNGFRTGTAFGNNDQSNNCGWSWSEVGYLPAGQDVDSVSYIVYQKGHMADSYGAIDCDRNPYLRISISDNIPNTIFLKNIKCELVSGGYADILTEEDYEYGKYHLMWANEAFKENNNSEFTKAYFMEEMDFVKGSIIGVPANSSILARPVLSARTDNPWHTGYDNYSYSSLRFYNMSNLNLYDGKDPAGISVEGVKYNNDASFFSITNTTNQDKYLLVKFNDKLEFTLTETTNDGYVMNSRGLPGLGYWVEDCLYFNGEKYHKLEKITDDTYRYKFVFSYGNDGEYYRFNLYSYQNVFGANRISDSCLDVSNRVAYSGLHGALVAGPLYSGKEYSIVFKETGTWLMGIGLEGETNELKEVINENPTWYYYDIDLKNYDLLGFIVTTDGKDYCHQTLNMNLTDEQIRDGVVYYAYDEEYMDDSSFDWANCTISTVENKPEYKSVDGVLRVYVSISDGVPQPRFWHWGLDEITGNCVWGFDNWNNRPYMPAATVTKTEKSPSGKYKGICKSADGTETVYMTISIDVENGTWSSQGYTDDTFSEEYYVGTALSTLEKDGDKFLLKFSSGINATSEDGWNSITFSGAYVGTLSRISD